MIVSLWVTFNFIGESQFQVICLLVLFLMVRFLSDIVMLVKRTVYKCKCKPLNIDFWGRAYAQHVSLTSMVGSSTTHTPEVWRQSEENLVLKRVTVRKNQVKLSKNGTYGVKALFIYPILQGTDCSIYEGHSNGTQTPVGLCAMISFTCNI